jgi:glucose/arabinose dehydrogenase
MMTANRIRVLSDADSDGILNAVGLATHPKTGQLWMSVNERDALGDNLVPDDITHVEEGSFRNWSRWSPLVRMARKMITRYGGARRSLRVANG